jgi:hypothetical protein
MGLRLKPKLTKSEGKNVKFVRVSYKYKDLPKKLGRVWNLTEIERGERGFLYRSTDV